MTFVYFNQEYPLLDQMLSSPVNGQQLTLPG